MSYRKTVIIVSGPNKNSVNNTLRAQLNPGGGDNISVPLFPDDTDFEADPDPTPTHYGCHWVMDENERAFANSNFNNPGNSPFTFQVFDAEETTFNEIIEGLGLVRKPNEEIEEPTTTTTTTEESS